MTDQAAIKKVLRAFENKDVGFISRAIIKQEVNPNALIPNKGVSLFHLIIGHPSESFALKITKLFLRCGGDPNVQSSDGVTPTHVAAGWGRNGILHLLLINGGDPWIQDDDRRNAFNYAFEEQEWNTIEMLHHFQQMHAATSCETDSLNSKIKFELERILLRKGEEIFTYSPVKHVNKSIMTEDKDLAVNSDNPPSPVQDRIKYFEVSHTSSLDNGVWRIPEKSNLGNLGWSKDVYETSKVIICGDPTKPLEDSTKKDATFITSFHLDTTPKKTASCQVKKSANDSMSKDVRGQLFEELQEAVRRRSKQKINAEQTDSFEGVPTEKPDSDSVVILKNDFDSNETFIREKSFSSCALNSVGNRMLKNMSDFATQVMEDMNTSINDEKTDGTIDLCSSSPESKNDDGNREGNSNLSTRPSGKMSTIVIPNCCSDSSTVYLTPFNSTLNGSELPKEASKDEDSNASFVSVSEEYRYADEDEGVVFLEKKLVVTPTVSPIIDAEDNAGDLAEEGEDSAAFSTSGSSSSMPLSLSCNSDVLRSELIALGHDVGPVTKTTKKIYLKKLKRIKKKSNAIKPNAPAGKLENSVHSPALKKTFDESKKLEEILRYRSLEEEMCKSFEKWTKRQWREGTNKTSFNYLLLDPRKSLNLPRKAQEMTETEAWKRFLSAIFYVGKGKRSRPYAHLYQAAAAWRDRKNGFDEKVDLITEIWREGLGVVCLQVFQNLMPVEAYTREAAMIDALDLASLRNVKKGEYYGVVSTWSSRDKQKLGIYLLYKAYLIFLNEGERQIKPYDI